MVPGTGAGPPLVIDFVSGEFWSWRTRPHDEYQSYRTSADVGAAILDTRLKDYRIARGCHPRGVEPDPSARHASGIGRVRQRRAAAFVDKPCECGIAGAYDRKCDEPGLDRAVARPEAVAHPDGERCRHVHRRIDERVEDCRGPRRLLPCRVGALRRERRAPRGCRLSRQDAPVWSEDCRRSRCRSRCRR